MRKLAPLFWLHELASFTGTNRLYCQGGSCFPTPPSCLSKEVTMSRYMALIPCLLIAVACDAPTSTQTSVGLSPELAVLAGSGPGKIVVNHDEWTLSNVGFALAPDAAQFARNVASWFTGGTPGNFLVYSNNFGLVGSSLANTMTAAGHSWTIVDPLSTPLPILSSFDAVFVAGNTVDNQALIDYVSSGGNVYVAAGTGVCCFPSAAAEAAAWNTFLNHFGLNYAPTYNFVRAVLPITSAHPIFAGVQYLYQDRGNSVSELNPSDPATDILEFFGTDGLYGVFESVVIQVAVDIKPGSDPNCIKDESKGSIPVAILSESPIDLADVDVSTVETEDMKNAGLLVDGNTLYVTGELNDGTPILGSDVIYLAGGPNCFD